MLFREIPERYGKQEQHPWLFLRSKDMDQPGLNQAKSQKGQQHTIRVEHVLFGPVFDSMSEALYGYSACRNPFQREKDPTPLL